VRKELASETDKRHHVISGADPTVETLHELEWKIVDFTRASEAALAPIEAGVMAFATVYIKSRKPSPHYPRGTALCARRLQFIPEPDSRQALSV
jgi:hypothetical protein